MDRLGWARSWMSQDVARSNAATAARRLTDRRREREAVDAFLARRLHAGSGDERPGPASAPSPGSRRPVTAPAGSGVAVPPG
jgi:hypothetical protein